MQLSEIIVKLDDLKASTNDLKVNWYVLLGQGVIVPQIYGSISKLNKREAILCGD